jgi:hypothetical protein
VAEEELAQRREKFQATHSRAELLEEIRRLIGLAPQDGPPARPFLASAPGVAIPEKSWTPENVKERSPVVLYLHDTDSSQDARPGGPIDLAEQRPVPQVELERAYRRCIGDYARQQSGVRLNLESSR